MKKTTIFIIFISFLIIILKTINAAYYPGTGDGQGIITINVIDSDECHLNFKQGWNLFSFCSELQDHNLLNVLSPIENKYRYVMRWDKFSQVYEIYSVLASENPFTTIDDDESYFIYMWEDAVLSVPGDESSSETRDLIKGWTTPSYPYRITRIIEDMYSTIMPDLRYIMKWNANNQEFQIYSSLSSENPFHELNKGEGQFIYMWNDNTLQY